MRRLHVRVATSMFHRIRASKAKFIGIDPDGFRKRVYTSVIPAHANPRLCDCAETPGGISMQFTTFNFG